MAQFNEQIAKLKAELAVTSSSVEREGLIRHIKELMELDGWQSGAFAKRIGALEVQVEELTTHFANLEKCSKRSWNKRAL